MPNVDWNRVLRENIRLNIREGQGARPVRFVETNNVLQREPVEIEPVREEDLLFQERVEPTIIEDKYMKREISNTHFLTLENNYGSVEILIGIISGSISSNYIINIQMSSEGIYFLLHGGVNKTFIKTLNGYIKVAKERLEQ